MKIYLLRHEKRYESPIFTTSLTPNGINTASSREFMNKLEQYKIDCIYSSPFVRCLQTIYYFSYFNNRKIRLDNSLYEYLEDPSFCDKKLDDSSFYKGGNREKISQNHLDFNNIIDDNYKSILDIDKLTYPENRSTLNERVGNFLKILLKKKESVLVVTHKSVIESFLDILKCDNNHEIDMGSIIEIEV